MMRPKYLHDLLPSEKLFLADWTEKRFGRYEGLRYENGQLVLNPWPKSVKNVRFGSREQIAIKATQAFELNEEVADFFEFVRAAGMGEIHCLEVRHGLPFLMEIESRPDAKGGR